MITPRALVWLIVLALVVWSGLVWAEPFAVSKPDSSGSTVTLHSKPGPCQGQAKLAVWASKDRKVTVPGCWVLSVVGGERTVLVSYLDGDRGHIKAAAFDPVTGL